MNSSGAYIERVKCRSTNCVKSPSGDCICVYGTVGVTGPVEVYGIVGVTGIQVGLTGAIGITGPVTVNGVVGVTGPVQVYGSVGVTGTVGITGTVGVTGPVEVYGAVGVTGMVGITGPVAVSGAVDITSMSNSDAFGRLRVSNPYTLLEFNQIQDKNEFLIDELISGAGTSTHTGSYTSMSVTGSGDSVIRQTHEYVLYQPGKSRLVLMTGVLSVDPATQNTISRIGSYGFDGGSGHLIGVYVEQDNGAVSVNLCDGDGLTTSVSRASWTDSLNGIGPSGVTVDFSKAQIFTFDFEWLGVGQVRCGVVFEGRFITYYTYTNANQLTAPYMRQAKLPLRYELISTGGANSMRMICGTVMSEGGFSPLGRSFMISNTVGATPFQISNSLALGTYIPMIAIRLRPTFPYNRSTVKIKSLELINTTFQASSVNTGAWRMALRPTVSGTLTLNNFDTANSALQYTTSFTGITYTGGRIANSGFYESRAQGVFAVSTDELIAEYPIVSDIVGDNPDVAIIEVNRLFGNQATNLYYILKWIELI